MPNGGYIRKYKEYFLKCAKQTTGIASINMRQLKGLPISKVIKFSHYLRERWRSLLLGWIICYRQQMFLKNCIL